MLVFDASTLILLAKTDLLDLFLDHLDDKAFITEKVEEECCRKPQAFDSLIIQKVIEEKRITVRALRSKSVYQKLQKDLASIRNYKRIWVSEAAKERRSHSL